MPFTGYSACARFGAPPASPSQMVSPAAHKSRVLGAYSGPITIAGAPQLCSHSADGFPKRPTEPTWLATSGAIGLGRNCTYSAGPPAGTEADVTKPATAAPWEYPPSTIRVLGQFAAVAWI